MWPYLVINIDFINLDSIYSKYYFSNKDYPDSAYIYQNGVYKSENYFWNCATISE
jgi:hypothetical protein